MKIRKRIECCFSELGALITAHPYWVIAANVLLVFVLALGALGLQLDTSFERYLPDNDPQRTRLTEFRQEYGAGERIVVMLRPKEVFDLGFLQELRALHQDFEENLPYVDKVTSLVNARRTYGTESSLITEDLMEEWPASPSDLVALRERVEANPLYENLVIAKSGRTAILSIEVDGSITQNTDDSFALDFSEEGEGDVASSAGIPLSTEQASEFNEKIKEILERHSNPDTQAHYMGTPIVSDEIGKLITNDTMLFNAISIVLIASLLFILFRSAVGVLYPVAVVGLSVVSTLGAMVYLGKPLTAITQILPSLLLAVGVGDSVHILSIFFRHYHEGNSRKASIVYALEHSGLAVVMTSVTTAVSMASFTLTGLQPTIDLGIAAPIGVCLAMLFSLSLLPALLVITPIKRRELESSTQENFIDRLLEKIGKFSVRYSRSVVLCTAFVWVFAGVGISTLYFSQDSIGWLPDEHALPIAKDQMNQELTGFYPLEVLIDTGKENGTHEPALLHAIEAMQEYAEQTNVGPVSAGQSVSLVDVVKETHQALNEGDPTYYTLPDNRPLISQELLLFESSGSDDLEDVADSTFQTARMTLTIPSVDALNYPRYVDHIEGRFQGILEEHELEGEVTVQSTGLLMVVGRTFQLLLSSMARSYSVAFVLIGLLMVFLIGDLRLGALSMIPNLTPIVIALGLMGWLRVPLDISTMLLGSILIGIAVDDTIHFVHNYNRYLKQTGSCEDAIALTLSTTGRAMLFTSTVLFLGFLVFTGSSLKNISAFGWLNAIGVAVAFLADIVLMPAIVFLVSKVKSPTRGFASPPEPEASEA